MARFSPDDYLNFRPYYPASTFQGFKESLLSRGFQEPFLVADIGCGTGHSTLSFLKCGFQSRALGIDLDPKMLEHAQKLAHLHPNLDVQFQTGTAEATGIASHSVDAVLVGSAFHWFDADRAKAEFLRILKPKGVLRVFEYQFPKSLDLPELNDWIRRQFNLYWKAKNQTPRGDFYQVTDGFRNDGRFESLSHGKPAMIVRLTADDLAGLIFSQSRVLCFEENLPASEKIQFRNETLQTLKNFFKNQTSDFDFKLAYFEFGLIQ